MLKHTRWFWLAATALFMASTMARTEEAKQVKGTKAPCKFSCKSGSSDVARDVKNTAAPGCGTASSLEILGRLAATQQNKTAAVAGCEAAEACSCSDACKCGASCQCSDSTKCHPSCKCSSARKASEKLCCKATKVAKQGCGSKQGKCGSKGCAAKKSDAKKKCECKSARKDATDKRRLAGKPLHPRNRHRPTFSPGRRFPSHPNPAVAGGAGCPTAHVPPHARGHVNMPHHPVHAAACRNGEAHVRQLHDRLVKLLAENAELKATAKVQQQLIAQQKQHHQQILETQAQMLRLQAQVELVSRREEIRDQLVEATAELAHADILMEIAAEHPEAFVKMMQGDECHNGGADTDAELQAIKAENAALHSKIAKLEKQMTRLIEHTAKQQRGPKSLAR